MKHLKLIQSISYTFSQETLFSIFIHLIQIYLFQNFSKKINKILISFLFVTKLNKNILEKNYIKFEKFSSDKCHQRIVENNQ